MGDNDNGGSQAEVHTDGGDANVNTESNTPDNGGSDTPSEAVKEGDGGSSD